MQGKGQWVYTKGVNKGSAQICQGMAPHRIPTSGGVLWQTYESGGVVITSGLSVTIRFQYWVCLNNLVL